MSPEQRKRWQALAEACLDKLEEMANDPETPKQLIIKITELAADRGWGKAAQSVALEGKDGEDLFKAFSDISESEVYAKAGIDKPKL